MNRKHLVLISTLLLAATPPVIQAQALISESFTGTATTNNWYFYGGACLTASSTAATTNPGPVPGCTTIASSYYGETLVGGSSNGTFPDASGALRFTNGYITGSTGGYSQNGAIISAIPYTTANGLNITFATVTYRGNTGGNGGSGNNTTAGSIGYGLPIAANDGADGMSFFLLNGTTTPSGVGSWGGSLGYTCSNSNPNYQGMPAAFLGLGIDEYGNFLNPGDNTASGPGLQANRIGLRGAGSINFASLSATYKNALGNPYYPASLSTITGVTLPNGGTGTAATYAVYDTCRTGMVWDYSKVTSASNLSTKKVETSIAVPDYAAIANGYTVLSGVKIADEYSNGGLYRNTTGVTPIYYRLKITPDGLLSLQYSYNGGAFNYVLQNQSLSAVSGSLPSTLYFGFGGSTGGSTNIHEILCFQAAPSTESSSSSAVNERQAAQLNSTTQAFFAYYNPNNWTGRLTANPLSVSGSTLTIGTPTWDAACILTGESATACSTGVATTVEPPNTPGVANSREIITWNGTKGVPFQWTNLSSTQQGVLGLGDSTSTTCYPSCRLNFLRGDRSQEINSSGVGLFRDRDNVLSDIVDSSPIWVGPPLASYTQTWRDRLYSGATVPENSGQTYLNYNSAQQGRLNVVYVGANDGMVHGFRAGSVTVNGTLVNNSTTPNDGEEVLAYVPGAVLASPALASASTTSGANNCSGANATLTAVQNIHGATPASGSATACSQAAIDFSNTQYGHNFFVDATPGTGDLFYNGTWHTWLVGGLGAGGAAVYALDITNPSATAFSESNAGALVVGEWTSATITCTTANCGANMGNSYGTPLIRRLHNGTWAVIFGNGIGSSTGDAGIFVMTIPTTTSSTPVTPTTYYLSTGVSGSNGIVSVAAADLDGDNITDYVYAGDLRGNVWRFDLTNSNPTAATLPWAVVKPALFTANSGQPITTPVVVATGVAGQTVPQVMVAFGTGQKFPLTNTLATSYATAAQSLYGFWDWNMSEWNGLNPAVQLASLSSTVESGSNCVPGTVLAPSNLQAQNVKVNTSNGDRDIATNATVLWPAATSCSSASRFGWSFALPGTNEQIIYDPQAVGSAFQVNSIVPAGTNLLSCNIVVDTGYTYALSLLTGGAIPGFFQNYTNDASGTPGGIQTNATGSSAVVNTSQSQNADASTETFLVYQTTSGTPSSTLVLPPNNITGQRMTWKQLR